MQPKPLKGAHLIHRNERLYQKLQLKLDEQAFFAVMSAQKKFNNTPAIAQLYAGHQFGTFVPQLGDGRSCLIGQVNGYEISLKGAGQTPYSRMGDGRAVLRSSIREYLCSEAMTGLAIPTTEALSLVGSDEPVQREQLETGAIISRVMKTNIRFGHFEVFASREQVEHIRMLADFVNINYFKQDTGDYVSFFAQVIKRTARLIALWQAYGFTHGVINSDNMSIVGDTIDYGPFGFVEHYRPDFVCNHTDHGGRYAFNQQPTVALWNLTRLANTLTALIDIDELNRLLKNYQGYLIAAYSKIMRAKLGLKIKDKNDNELLEQLLTLLYEQQIDYTYALRMLSHYNGQSHPFSSKLDNWFDAYNKRLRLENTSVDTRQQQMLAVNPKYILRNYLAEHAINASQQNNHCELNALFHVLSAPFDEHPEYEQLSTPVPPALKNVMLSCSS